MDKKILFFIGICLVGIYIDMIYEYKPKEKELYVKTKWKYKKRQKPYEREQKFNEFDKINIWFGI